MGELSPREEAEKEAKETYARFLDWCKKGTFIICFYEMI